MLKQLALTSALAGLLLGAPRATAADRLGGEASAFLKSFADSPVDWMPWGEEAVARAKSEQKPVFVFVGSFTSELSGAMRRQSFANAKTADWLNQQFVCVLVDRDEHPDVAALYEAYVSNLKQLSGWPLNVFLTPDFLPYEGATYLSPSEDWGAPGFLKLANQAKTAWATGPAACRKRAADSVSQLAETSARTAAVWNLEKCRSSLAEAAASWEGTFDPAHGSFGDTPKAPEPELIRFMLLQPAADRESALAVLRALAASAVRDPLDGGFFRRASDAAWKIPYQQKTLADQGRIALAFLDGARGGPDGKSFRECAFGALDFALGHLANPDGSFASAQDATGDDYTGYYAWTEAEIDRALGPGAPAFKAAHGVMPGGNVPAGDDPSGTFTGKNLLLSTAVADPALAGAVARLAAVRAERRAPLVDHRASAAAQGLFMTALCRAGAQYLQPRYVGFAHNILAVYQRDFLLSPDGSMRHLAGSPVPATAQDYAAAALGCRALAEISRDKVARDLADKFLAQLSSRYFDPVGGAYFAATRPLGPGFFFRPYGAEEAPSAEALALTARAINSTAVAAQLSAALEESSLQAPGDLLLALAYYSNDSPSR